MPALNRSDRLAKDLGPLYMKSLAERLTGSAEINNHSLEVLYTHLREVGNERNQASDDKGRFAALVQGGEADHDSDHEADRDEVSEEGAHGGWEEGQDGLSEERDSCRPNEHPPKRAVRRPPYDSPNRWIGWGSLSARRPLPGPPGGRRS